MMNIDISLLMQEVPSVTHLTLVKVSYLNVCALSMKLFLCESFSVTRENDIILIIFVISR